MEKSKTQLNKIAGIEDGVNSIVNFFEELLDNTSNKVNDGQAQTESGPTVNLQTSNANQEENIAKKAEASVVTGENSMSEELKKQEEVKEEACGSAKKEEKKVEKHAEMEPVQNEVVADAEAPIEAEAEVAAEAKKEDEPKAEEEKPAEEKAEEPKEDKPADTGVELKKDVKDEPKKEIKDADFKKAEGLLNKVLKNELAEAGEGEEESEDIKNIKEALSALGMKEEKPEGALESAEDGQEFPFAADPIACGACGTEAAAPVAAPVASYTARFQKKATLGESTWIIKNASTNEDFVSFDVKAAFGKDIDKDEIRAKYASSKEFGRAVMASLIENKVASALGVQAAVLQVVAHYTPCYPSAAMFKANTKSSFPKASGAGDTANDATLLPAKVAAQEAGLEKTAAETASLPGDGKLLPGAEKRSEKVNTKVEESATPANSTKVESETDKKLIASYESKLKALAEENNKLKIEAQLQEKTAIAKECITLMVKAGLLRANEQVRIAALKDGLSIEAANAKAIAASINEQTKCLLGMPTAQLNAYKQSIAHLQPAVAKTASVDLPVMNVKASVADSAKAEEERILSILEWDD